MLTIILPRAPCALNLFSLNYEGLCFSVGKQCKTLCKKIYNVNLTSLQKSKSKSGDVIQLITQMVVCFSNVWRLPSVF